MLHCGHFNSVHHRARTKIGTPYRVAGRIAVLRLRRAAFPIGFVFPGKFPPHEIHGLPYAIPWTGPGATISRWNIVDNGQGSLLTRLPFRQIGCRHLHQARIPAGQDTPVSHSTLEGPRPMSRCTSFHFVRKFSCAAPARCRVLDGIHQVSLPW